MRNETRQLFDAFLERQAELNHVADASKQFAIEPSVDQKLINKLKESAAFLDKINIYSPDEMKGEIIGLDTSGPIASRTDTAAGERLPKDVVNLSNRTFDCAKTDFDTAIKYQILDQWAKFDDFQIRLSNQILRQQALDHIMIGWHGESRAADTDLVANPMLQDVNIGWLKHIRDDAPAQRLNGAKVGDQAGKDYKNLDALVLDASNTYIAPWHRDRTDLVCISSRGLLTEKFVSLVEDHEAPTEKNAMKTLMANQTVGGHRADMVPYVPDRSLLITPYSNLSIYSQVGSRRRRIIDNPKRDRIETYDSANVDYVVEDYEACVLIDGVELPDGAGGWA